MLFYRSEFCRAGREEVSQGSCGPSCNPLPFPSLTPAPWGSFLKFSPIFLWISYEVHVEKPHVVWTPSICPRSPNSHNDTVSDKFSISYSCILLIMQKYHQVPSPQVKKCSCFTFPMDSSISLDSGLVGCVITSSLVKDVINLQFVWISCFCNGENGPLSLCLHPRKK